MPETKKTATPAKKTARKTPARKKTPAKAAAPKRATARKSTRKSVRKKAVAAPPTTDQIATRAYFLWQAGGQDPVANWLAAEQQLSAGL